MNDEYLDQFVYKGKDIFLDQFSKGFKNFLERKKLTTRDIAKILNITDSSVSSWKYGRAFPDFPNLIRLFMIGLSPFEIMDRTSEKIARIGDCEFRYQKNQKDIDFIKSSSISDEITAEYLAELQKENYELDQEIKDFYKNR